MEKGSNRTSLAWIARLAGRQKSGILLLLAVQGLMSGMGLLMTWCLRSLINAATGREEQAFWYFAAFLGGIVVFQVALRALDRILDERIKATLENRLKGRLFHCLFTKEFAAVTRTHSGEWLNRLTSDTAVVSEGVAAILPGLFGMLVKLLGALGLILALAPGLVAFLLPFGVLLLLFSAGFRKALKRLHRHVQETDGKLRVFLTERLGSMLILRSYAKEGQAARDAKVWMDGHMAARMRRAIFSGISNAGFAFIMYGTYVFGAVWCGLGILSGTLSYGTLVAVLQLIGQVQSPFANISGYLPKFYAMLASAERLMEAEAYGEDCPDGHLSPGEIRDFYGERFRAVGLRNASFQYPSRAESDMLEVLDCFSLEVGKGEYVALTGPSGCGKSTVLKLLLRLYPLDSGEVYLRTGDGEEPLTPKLRGLFAYVPQGNQLMCGTIREVLSFSEAEEMADGGRLREALRIACADGFVLETELGLDAVLGERGAGLSEGQMQRIAIARAILADRPVLLLDEATSALDEATEAKLLSNLRAMTDKTVIIVTHRPAALAVCDRQVGFAPGMNRTEANR